MTSVVFPVYLLARMLVSRGWALFAAAASAAIPALTYSTLIIEEPYAYPVARRSSSSSSARSPS